MSAIVYSPVKLRASARSQRIITPSPEKTLSNNTMLISPKKRAVSYTSTSDTGSPQKKLALPKNSEVEIKAVAELGSQPEPLSTMSRRIVFDDFTLVLPDGYPRTPNDEESDLIMKLFPTTVGWEIRPPFLIIRVQQLPSKPWPLSVAGLPLYLTTDCEDVGFDHGMPGRGGKALHELDARADVTKPILNAIIHHFEERLHIQPTSIMCFKGFWLITVPDGTDMKAVPGILGRVVCNYNFESQQSAPREAALRLIEPTTEVRDTGNYVNNLRPGVMLCSTGGGVDMFTTSGVAVRSMKDPNEKYITVAAHGFPLGQENVYHPTMVGTHIGTVEKRLESTDIALIKLKPGLLYQNQTFEAQLQGVPPSDIKRVCRAGEFRVADCVHMNTPFTGYYDMQVTAVGVNLMKVTEEERALWTHIDEIEQPGLRWVDACWAYTGNSNIEPMDGCCGAPILSLDNDLVACFRFLRGTHCISVGAHILERFGFELDVEA